jgi:hypothetical protein
MERSAGGEGWRLASQGHAVTRTQTPLPSPFDAVQTRGGIFNRAVARLVTTLERLQARHCREIDSRPIDPSDVV